MILNKIKLYTGLLLAAPLLLTSCLDETQPTSGMTEEQVGGSVDGLIAGISKHMNTIVNENIYGDVGYPSLMIHRDQMTADAPVRDPSMFYFNTFNYCRYLGDWPIQQGIWLFYNGLVQRSNLAIKACDEDLNARQLATALCYRAFAHIELARMYEYMPTGTSLDGSLGTIKGLTVPIVTETTTQQQAFRNPRAPYYKLWRYIYTDLNRAARAVAKGGESGLKNQGSASLVYGLQARLWLDIATRFERYPEDMATALAHEEEPLGEDLGSGYVLDPLGVTDAKGAWRNAAKYARLAIAGHAPLTKDEWFSPTSGFNTSSVSSWIFAIMMSSSDEMVTGRTWQSWVSYMSPETTYGVASNIYKTSFMIDRNLYEQIGEGDWRKYTWIDPDLFEAGEEAFKQYYADKTNLTYDAWSLHAPYVGFKFHPGQGVGNSYLTGNCVDIPLMRVEEMYFIEAEASAYAYGVGQGKALLEEFMNGAGARYEGTPYVCKASNLDDFTTELLLQKRIEFWGEGIVCFDMRRWGTAVTRRYEGTNHFDGYQLNSPGNGLVPAWSTLFIPRNETHLNTSCLQNPDPSEVTSFYN